MEKYVERLLRGRQFKNLLECQYKSIQKQYDLKKVDIEVLYYLYKNPERNTAKDIQNFFKINKGYLSQTLDRLNKRGYLSTIIDEKDRRYIHYRVLTKTKAILDEIRYTWENVDKKIFVGVSEEEQQIFKRVAKKIEENIQEMLGE